MRNINFTLLLGIILLLLACSRINFASRDFVPLSSGLVKRLDEASLARGKDLYAKHCPSCHGLMEVLQNESIDLAVIKKHHNSWPEKHILGSVSARVLELYRGNVLAI